MKLLSSNSAPAKINLTLRVLGRRADGYHELESLVAFADVGDGLQLQTGAPLALEIDGPYAEACGAPADNLVLKAAAALAARVERLRLGRFVLTKELPVASGIGGGSADAAAALRLLVHGNREIFSRVDFTDARLHESALAVGADVPVCLASRARIMRGVGEKLSEPLDLPPLPALLVNPGVPLSTREVFGKLAGRIQQSVIRRSAARLCGTCRLASRKRQRSHPAGHRLRAGDRRRAEQR